MKFVFVTFFVIIAADVARSQGVRRERPPDLPKTSTKKGQRPSGRPIRVRNFGPPPPPRPPGERNYYDFNFYHRRKDPIIPVELHPPILQRPKPKDSSRERPRSRSANRPKRRRTTTTAEPTPPTTYYDLTTFPTTSTTPSIAPPTKPPVKSTTKQTPISPKVQVEPQTTTKASIQKASVENQKATDKAISISNNTQTHPGNKQGHRVTNAQASGAENINPVQTSNSVSSKRMYARTFFGANKIPRPPPLPSQAYRSVVDTGPKFTKKSESTVNQVSQGFKKQKTFSQTAASYKIKSVPRSNSIFEKQRTKFRRPSDIPVELKPNIISSLTTETESQPSPSNPEKYAWGHNSQVYSNIETNQVRQIYTKQETHMSQNNKNKQFEATHERASPGGEFHQNIDTNTKQNTGPKNAQIEQSVSPSKYSLQSSYQEKFENEAISLTSSTDPRPVSTSILSQMKPHSRDVPPEVASAFIENRVQPPPQRSSPREKVSTIGDWQNQQFLPKPFRSNPVGGKNNPSVTGGISVDQTSVHDGKSRSLGSINRPGSFISLQTNSISINSAPKSSYSNENKPLENTVKTPHSLSQTSGEGTQIRQIEIYRPLSDASLNKTPYEDSIRPIASKFNTMNMKSGVIPSVRQNFNGHKTSKPLQNVGLLGPKLPLDRPEALLNSRIIGETGRPSNNRGSNQTISVSAQRPFTSGRFKEKQFRSVGSNGPSIGTVFNPSANSASYSLGLDQIYSKDVGIGRISSQAEQLANRNTIRPHRKNTINSPNESSAEPFLSRPKQTGSGSQKTSNQHKQLSGIEQQPDRDSSPSKQGGMSADFNVKSRLVEEKPTTSRRERYLVKPTSLPDGNTYSYSHDQYYLESPVKEEQGKQFNNSPVGEVGPLSVKKVSPKMKNTGFSLQAEHVSNINPYLPPRKTSENPPKDSSAVKTETFYSGSKPISNVSPNTGIQHKQLPGIEQQPEWASSDSRHGEISADFIAGSHFVAEKPDMPTSQHSLVKPNFLPNSNNFNDKFSSGGSFNEQQRKQFISSPGIEVGSSHAKEVSRKLKITFPSSNGLNNQQNLGNNAFPRSGHLRATGKFKKSQTIGNIYSNTDSQVKQQQTKTISHLSVEQRKPNQPRKLSRKRENIFNPRHVQSDNAVTGKFKTEQAVFPHHSSTKDMNIAMERKVGQNRDLTSNGKESVSNNAQNKQQADQSNKRGQSDSGSEPVQNSKDRAGPIEASTTVKSKPIKMSKSASERVRKVGSLMLEAFNDFLSKINGGKALPSPITNGKKSAKQNTSPSVDTNYPNEPVKSKNSVGKGRTSARANKRDSNLKSKTSASKSTKSSKKLLDKPSSKSTTREGVVRNPDGEKQSSQQFNFALKEGSSSHSLSKTAAISTSKIANNWGAPIQRSEGGNANASENGKPITGKSASLKHKSKGKTFNHSKRRISNELAQTTESSANNSAESNRQTTITSTAKRANDKGYRFESDIISGPPPPSFRKDKNISSRSRKLNERNKSNKKGLRKRKNRGRIGSKKSGSQNNVEKEPPGYNVPAGAHPPVLTRSIAKGSRQGGSSASPNSAEKTSKPSVQGGSGKQRQGPCSLSPVCGSDGFTYMSSCFLWEGLTVACDGYCPCPSVPSKPVLKQTSQTGVVREQIPSPMCNCPAKYSPMCSTSGRTFENDCARACNGEQIACDGECPCPRTYPKKRKPCESYCSATFRPVCSVWGYSYENDCLRHCSGEAKACDGECPCPYNQNVVMDPVGGNYDPQNVNNEPSNQPLSTCECRPGDIDPVCTTSGETLWYGCEAICLGYTIACSSECPC